MGKPVDYGLADAVAISDCLTSTLAVCPYLRQTLALREPVEWVLSQRWVLSLKGNLTFEGENSLEIQGQL